MSKDMYKTFERPSTRCGNFGGAPGSLRQFTQGNETNTYMNKVTLITDFTKNIHSRTVIMLGIINKIETNSNKGNEQWSHL